MNSIDINYKIIMVRHAPVLEPKNSIYGDTAIIDLDSDPIRKKLQYLASNLPSPTNSYWLDSGVDRARKTAIAVKELQSNKSSSVIYSDKGFREQDFGDLIGLSHEQAGNYIEFYDGKIYTDNPPNGENIKNFIDRVGNAIENLISELHDFQTAVIFCHGGTIRAANIYLNDLNDKDFISLDTLPLSMHDFVYKKR